jgi:hypothetical protein
MQYAMFAAQCDVLALSAKLESARREYRHRARVWRQLGEARLPGGSEQAHFKKRAPLKGAQNGNHKPTGDNARKGARWCAPWPSF